MCGERWWVWVGSIIIGKSIEQLSGMQSTSFVMPPRGLYDRERERERVKLEAAGPATEPPI